MTILKKKIELTEFAQNSLFDPERAGTNIVGLTPKELEEEFNIRIPVEIHQGYAPFCQLWVFENWTKTKTGTMEITPENHELLRSGYKARTNDELAVLTRWFESCDVPVAEYLVVIMYDAEQMAKEGNPINADFGIVAVLAQTHPNEEPINPIAMMRNALGMDEGGSGVVLDRNRYRESVKFWSKHATIKI